MICPVGAVKTRPRRFGGRFSASRLSLLYNGPAIKRQRKLMGTVRSATVERSRAASKVSAAYVLGEQVGFILRLVSQRHANIFLARIGCDLTQTQWGALAKLYEVGPISQNRLGRITAMDVATIKGVVDRLIQKGLVVRRSDSADARRHLIVLTKKGRARAETHFSDALAISGETLAPLSSAERSAFLRLLAKLT
jgi:MarR family transcriptional regulator, lower aerobic nicotinate degradation pathway regulator